MPGARTRAQPAPSPQIRSCSGTVATLGSAYVVCVNVVTLIGNLATDVDLRELGDEKKVARFLLAVNRRGAEAGADFVRVAAWGKQAETCASYLGKGRRVAVDGRLRSHSWEDREGKRRHSVEVVANHVQFLSGSGDTSEVPFEAAAPS